MLPPLSLLCSDQGYKFGKEKGEERQGHPHGVMREGTRSENDRSGLAWKGGLKARVHVVRTPAYLHSQLPGRPSAGSRAQAGATPSSQLHFGLAPGASN